jgi:hypothetical protein
MGESVRFRPGSIGHCPCAPEEVMVYEAWAYPFAPAASTGPPTGAPLAGTAWVLYVAVTPAARLVVALVVLWYRWAHPRRPPP